MAVRMLLFGAPTRSYATSILSSHSWNRWASRSYGTAQKVEFNVQHRFKDMTKPLDFDQFREKKVKSFEDFKKSPSMEALFGNDIEKISIAYQDYCICKYNRYLQSNYGGNAATML